MEEERCGRVICWRKNHMDSFFIVYSKRTLRFIERFQCNNAVLLRDGFIVDLGQCYSIKYARYEGSDCHVKIYQMKKLPSICEIRNAEKGNGTINLLVECNWESEEEEYVCPFGPVFGIPSPLLSVKVWCQLMKGSEINLGFVEFVEKSKTKSSSSVSGSSTSSISSVSDSAYSITKEEHKNEIKGFDLKGNFVTIVSRNYSCFTKNEMGQLYKLAEKYCDGKMYPFDVLHRCKPKKYFETICEYPGAMMWPYMKDENGHRKSPINRNIPGLFFNTAAMCNKNNSPYGNVQLVMDAGKIVDINKMNLYFADFYCNEMGPQGKGGARQGSSSSSALHYFTIVVCPKSSSINDFCNEYLIQLDPHENKFLKVAYSSNGQQHKYFTAYKSTNKANHRQELMVEVFYTEPVSLNEADEIRKIDTFGRGRSLPNGLPNNKKCCICNI